MYVAGSRKVFMYKLVVFKHKKNRLFKKLYVQNDLQFLRKNDLIGMILICLKGR